MSRLKTALCAIALCSSIPPGPSQADTGATWSNDPRDLVTFFSQCTGQLSALMEFQWLTYDPASDETARVRAQMIELLQAVMPPDQGRQVLSTRISAKHAFARLLHRSHFNDDPDDIQWSAQRIARTIANCQGLLLH